MRSLWLASAAICMTAGVAMAQTSSAPAPTGAPNAAAASPAPGASPGNMAPANGMSGSGGSMSSNASGSSGSMGMTSSPPATTSATGGLTSGSSSTAATSPHYTGQDTVSQPTGQASSGDKAVGSVGMVAPAQQSASSSNGGGMTHTAMTYRSQPSLPANADAATYLRIASRAIKDHNKALADEALSNAETLWLTRAVPASSGATVDDSPGVKAIEHARQDLASGDYQTAASDTRMAMHAHHGMMGAEGMNGSGMGGGSDMAPMSGAGAMGGPAQ